MNMVIVLISGGGFAYFLALRYWRRRKRLATEVCRALVQTICDLQRHRGLSVAVLDGEKRFRDECYCTEQVLHHGIQAVAEKYSGGFPALRGERWEGLVVHWRSLGMNWRELDFLTSLHAHNDAVMAAIEVLGEVVRTHGWVLGGKRVGVLLDWPALIEHLGMTRALGVHLLSREAHGGPKDERARRALEAHRRHALRSLERLGDSLPDATIRAATEQLLERVTALSVADAHRYEPRAYYLETTAVIDAWYAMMNGQIMIEEPRRGPMMRRFRARRAW